MFSKLVDAMFGCRHARYSFPMTIRGGSRRNKNVARIGTYVACLDCGKEFTYDWREMRIVDGNPSAASRSLVVEKAA
jgi:hypothetical protein